MALIDLWTSSPEQITDKHVKQIIAFAGSGKLLDGSEASHEFRSFLSQAPSVLLTRYATECLSEKFENSGLALQDVINEVGTRLGFFVTHGRYRGTPSDIGFDGLWKTTEDEHLVIEVKTTDAYRISLDTLAKYRRQLIQATKIEEDNSSTLIVVGRQDTGDLEAQIRGSRHAWEMRLISVEAILRLMSIKEEVDDPTIARKISNILIPRQYTRLDDIIDVVFSTASGVLDDLSIETLDKDSTEPKTPKFIPVKFNEACIERIQKKLGVPLIRKSRSTFAAVDDSIRIVCAVSKTYNPGKTEGYWYAFTPHQQEFLEEGKSPYVAFGCGSSDTVLLIPYPDFKPWLNGMNVTEKEDRMYWHVIISSDADGFIFRRKPEEDRIDLTKYLLRS